jgi:hypothetical protein
MKIEARERRTARARYPFQIVAVDAVSCSQRNAVSTIRAVRNSARPAVATILVRHVFLFAGEQSLFDLFGDAGDHTNYIAIVRRLQFHKIHAAVFFIRINPMRRGPDGDGLKWFNWLYRLVTNAVDAVPPAGGWKNPQWLTQLDVVFANLYFSAVESQLHGRTPSMRIKQVLFEVGYAPTDIEYPTISISQAGPSRP